MVRVAYLTRINFFSAKAHVHTITKTCEVLSKADGIELKLVSTDDSLSDKAKEAAFLALHGAAGGFELVSLASLSNRLKNSTNFFVYNLGTILANVTLLSYVWTHRKEIDLIYFRDHLILPVALFAKHVLRKKLVYESHYVLSKRFGQWLTERSVSASDGIVAIAEALKEHYRKRNQNIIVSFCASSDRERYSTTLPKSHFRRNAALADGKFYAVYTGNIDVTGNGDSYGIEDVVRALPLLPDDAIFVAVGKKTAGKHPLEKLAESLGVPGRFVCVPWVSREKVVEYILSADVLVIPKSGARPGNSPTKMFEYLGTGIPVVAADTPAIREVLHDKRNALLVRYAEPKAWPAAVAHLRENPEYGKRIAAQAFEDAGRYTWEARGESIAALIRKIHA